MWFSQSPIENHFFVTPHKQIHLPNIFWKSEMGLGWTKTQVFFLNWSSTCPFPSSRLWNSFLQNNLHFHICIYPARVLILFRRIPRKKLPHFCRVCLIPRNSYASIDHNTYKSDWTSSYRFHISTPWQTLLNRHRHCCKLLYQIHEAEQLPMSHYTVLGHHTQLVWIDTRLHHGADPAWISPHMWSHQRIWVYHFLVASHFTNRRHIHHH